MADDLDAFFDEVSAAEEEAKRDSKEDDKRDINGGKNGEEALTAEESPKNDQGDERPVKRPKVHLASAGGAVVISKAAVVVAAKPAIVAAAQPTVVVSKPSTTTDVGESAVTTIKPIAPAPPPLPPGPPPPPIRQPGTSIGPQIGPSFRPTVSAIGPIGPSAIPPPPPPPPAAAPVQYGHAPIKRSAAGKSWEDRSLAEFPENDFRLFVGNLAKDIREDQLADAFRSRYPSFAMSRICRNKDDGKSRGYGFVSVMDPKDLARALREMDQTWLGSRPIKVRKSEWKDRDLKEVRKKQRYEKRRNKRHL
eukprot:CAMPEP_0113533802 /NCGR_PEP_ID=MMETSP0015_2-20120614/4810_1 /TAXON_ID=2838 /ORGANISM="Odontella" /LENGTH=306 /DNA_ID=CAMNT_0000432901 /DNA_START=77 /DNA_END=994 /DNA_ORIENTATION=+ /assembly_acc=CAM_ASM_000160